VPAGTELAAYGRGEWRWAHQDEIRREYGYRPFGHAGVEDELVGWLRARVWVSAESHPVLFARAVEHLIGAKVLLPGASTVWRLVGAARERVDERGWTLLGGALTDEQRGRLEGLLAVAGGRRESELERLRQVPVEPTVAGLIATLERLCELRVVADGLSERESLPVARVRALTVDAATRRAGDLAKMSDARRLATLVAFATLAAQRGQDDALEHFDRLHGELQLRVRKQGERERLRDGHEIDRAGLTLVDACRTLLAAAPHQPVADAIFTRVDRAGLADAVAAMERLARSPEDRARDLILTRYSAVRRYLPLLLDTLDFHATDAGEPILDSLDALQRTARQRRLTPQELPTELIPRHWRPLVEPEPGRLDRAAYTMCALEALRDGLRRRDVYVARSERYGDPRASLLDAPTWNASRADVCRSLSLPETPEPFLKRFGAELDAAYRRTLEGLHAEHPIHELATGRLPVEQLDALPEPPSLLAVRDQVDRRLPDADLPDLLLEIAAKTGFLDGFTHEHEPRARLSDLQTSICAVLVAEACNVGYAPLVDETVPALREARLKYVARHYIRPETLIAANARIVDYHAALELATRWGGGEVASIDGLRFVVPNRTIHAGYNRRYYHRRRGVTALTTTADHHATLHTIVVPGTQPDALYLLDGLLDPQTSVRPREVMTDTAGLPWTGEMASAPNEAAPRTRLPPKSSMSIPPSHGDAPGCPICRKSPLVSATSGSRGSISCMRISAPQSKLWIVTRLTRPASRISRAVIWTNCSRGAVCSGAPASTLVIATLRRRDLAIVRHDGYSVLRDLDIELERRDADLEAVGEALQRAFGDESEAASMRLQVELPRSRCRQPGADVARRPCGVCRRRRHHCRAGAHGRDPRAKRAQDHAYPLVRNVSPAGAPTPRTLGEDPSATVKILRRAIPAWRGSAGTRSPSRSDGPLCSSPQTAFVSGRLEYLRVQHRAVLVAQRDGHAAAAAVDRDVPEVLVAVRRAVAGDRRGGREDAFRAERAVEDVERVGRLDGGVERTGDELPERREAADRGARGIVVVGGGVVDVGGDEDQVRHALIVGGPQDLGEFELAAERRAVVSLRHGLVGGRAVGDDEGERQVVGDHLPGRLGGGELALEPFTLCAAQQSALWIGVAVAVVGVLVRMSSTKTSSSGP